jgi:hypothetical protein
MLRPVDRGLSLAPSVQDDPLGAFKAAGFDVEAVLDDPELAGIECDTANGRMTVERRIDEVVGDELALHGCDLARASEQDDTIDPDDVERLWSMTAAIPAEVMAKYRTPGAFGRSVEVFGPKAKVPEDVPLQVRLLGLIGRDPSWAPGLRLGVPSHQSPQEAGVGTADHEGALNG